MANNAVLRDLTCLARAATLKPLSALLADLETGRRPDPRRQIRRGQIRHIRRLPCTALPDPDRVLPRMSAPPRAPHAATRPGRDSPRDTAARGRWGWPR